METLSIIGSICSILSLLGVCYVGYQVKMIMKNSNKIKGDGNQSISGNSNKMAGRDIGKF